MCPGLPILTDKCPTCGRKKTRSLAQNARYFKLLRELSDKLGFDVDVLHEFCKRKFLGVIDVEMPDWTTQTLAVSTAKLPQHGPEEPNWDSYTLMVEHFAAENGVYLEEA